MDLIISSDLIGNRIGLKIKSEFYHKSFLGGILSIILGVMTVAATLSFGMQIIYKINLKVIQTSDYESLPNMNLTRNFPLVVNVVRRGAFALENFQSYYNISVVNYNQINTNGTPVVTLSEKKIRICTDKDLNGRKSQLLEVANPSNLSLYYCLQQDQNLEIYGQMGTRKVNYLAILIKRCVNGTDVVCKSREMIDAQFTNVFIQFISSDYYFDSTNYNEPGQIYFKSTNIPITSNFYKRAYLYYHNVDYITDSGLIYQRDEKRRYYQFDSYKEVIFFDKSAAFTPDTLAEVTITASVIKSQFFRYGYKLQQLAADVGGIIKSMLILAEFVIELINRNYLNVKIVNSLFFLKKIHKEDNDESGKNSLNENSKQELNEVKNLPIINSYINPNSRLPNLYRKKKLKYCHYICCKNENSKRNILFSKYVINKTLEVKNIIATMNDFQAYKTLLFNEDQIMITDYMLRSKFFCKKARVVKDLATLEESMKRIKENPEEIDFKISKLFNIN
jgi:hypothetical protein